MADDIKVLIGEINGTELEYPQEHKLKADEVPFDNSSNGFTAIDVQAAIEEAATTGNSGVDPDHIVWIAKNGNDTTGDGTYHNPFLTIKKGVDSINDNDINNRYLVQVCPGVYVEDIIELKSYVSVESVDGGVSVRISPSNPANPIFKNNTGLNKIKGLSLGGSTSGSAYLVDQTVFAMGIIEDCAFLDNNVCVDVRFGNTAIRRCTLVPDGNPISTVCKVSGSGKLFVDGFLAANGIMTNFVEVLGSTAQLLANNIVMDGCLATYFYKGDASQAFFNNTTLNGKFDYGFNCENGAIVGLEGVIINSFDQSLVPYGIGLNIDNAKVNLTTGRIISYIALQANNSSDISLFNVNFKDAPININIIDINTIMYISGGELNKGRLAFLPGVQGVGYFIDRKPGDEGLIVYGELSVGRPDLGKESVFGEGDSYTAGMAVYNSDGTDTTTTEGVLTDITSDANEIDTNYFGFQGTTTNHCIYVTTSVTNNAFTETLEFARLVGLKVNQKDAAVELVEKSFAIEYWDGAAWVETQKMATESNKYYNYSDKIFIRSNSSEHIRFGRNLLEETTLKTIAGMERHWVRIRIKNDLSVAPTFNQFKISNNRTEINSDGTITLHGTSRFRSGISFASNTFGEKGGVTNSSVPVGLGVEPYSWDHEMRNNRMNGNGDSITGSTAIPAGTDTSQPISINIKYMVLSPGASTDGNIEISVLPVEVTEIPVADPAGGIIPINRSHTNTTPVNTVPAQVKDLHIHLEDENIIYSHTVTGFSIEGFYEKDMILFRIEYEDNGSANKDIAIIGVEILGVKWSLGGKY